MSLHTILFGIIIGSEHGNSENSKVSFENSNLQSIAPRAPVESSEIHNMLCTTIGPVRGIALEHVIH